MKQRRGNNGERQQGGRSLQKLGVLVLSYLLRSGIAFAAETNEVTALFLVGNEYIYSRNNLQIENWMKRYEVFLLHISYCVTFETTKALRMPQYDYIRGREIFLGRVLASSCWFTNFILNKQLRIISGKASLVGIFLYSEEVTFLFSLL